MSESDTPPSKIVSDAPNAHTLTDDQLHTLVRDVAMASYRAARYRGQMRADALDATKQKVITRKADEWLNQHKDEYV